MNVIITVINDVVTDRRVQKHTSLLKELGCNLTVVGRHLNRSPVAGNPDFKVIRLRLLFEKGPWMYISFNIRLFLSLLFRKADLYIANDLDTLLPCFILSRLRKKPLIYDSHEYFTGQHGLEERKLVYGFWKRIEKSILPKIRWMITVSDSIARLYCEEYGINPVVVRNLAPSSAGIKPVERSATGARDEDLLIVLQGSGINPGRGTRELIDAIALTERVFLLVIGAGDELGDIQSMVENRNLSHKVGFLPRMSWESMMSYTKCCDAGVTLDRDTCLNQRYSLPNKLFDYLSAGIPVIASALPEVSSIICRYNCGVLVEKVEPLSISEAITKIRDNPDLLDSMKIKASQAFSELNWERESVIELELFRTVISQSKSSK